MPYDAMNDKESYDQETINMMNDEDIRKMGLIIVATAILMVGLDYRGVVRIINVEPADFDEELQKEGRLLREKDLDALVQIGESYLYVSKKTLADAKQLLEEGVLPETLEEDEADPLTEESAGRLKSVGKEKLMDVAFAKRLVADCRTEIQNKVYNNPPYGEPICSCSSSICTRIRLQNQDGLRQETKCLCSGCHPKACKQDRLELLSQQTTNGDNSPDTPANHSDEAEQMDLTQMTQEIIRTRLVELDDELFEKGVGDPGGRLTPGMFIPEGVISTIIKNFTDLAHPDHLSELLQGFKMHPKWIEAIQHAISRTIIPEINKQHKQRQKERAEDETRIMLLDLKDEDIPMLEALSPKLVLFAGEKDKNYTMSTKRDLSLELQWHRIWNPRFAKPKTAWRKAEYIEPLNEAIQQFIEQKKTVEGVRRILATRHSLLPK
ncbi:hypothetical protein PQX77_019276 [Marasmius sp. AFHP31]|nr:hypothetical protein PQX77_019276 [Marasmius sp. AFHP31]